MLVALPTPVDLRPGRDGLTEVLADGSTLWRARVAAPGATDLALAFENFELPGGATLHVTSEIFDFYEGPYTADDNRDHGQLWVPAIPGDRAVVELHLPAGVSPSEISLRLTSVARGFRDLLGTDLNYGAAKQGGCNNDVICPVGDPWRDEIRSVARYVVSGSGLCTGTLIMDTASSFRNFFLTAAHCGLNAGNAPSVVVYWNYEAPTCGSLSGGPLGDNQSGTVFRASRNDVDMALLELEEDPAPTSAVYYAGWDRSNATPPGSVGIHHPDGDEKAISFNVDSLATVNSCIGTGGVNSHWLVDDWEDGTTELGSSGSGLWDSSTHRLVGFLSGGSASCGNPGGSDCYGKFSVAWDGSGPATRLRDWLDAGDTGALGVAGSDPAPVLRVADIGALDTCAANPAQENLVVEPAETIEISPELRATGSFTGIDGLLTTVDPAVTLLDDMASWPYISQGATAQPTTPLRIDIDAGATCLGSVMMNLKVTTAEGGPFDFPIELPVGALPTTELPRSIPDDSAAGVASTLEITRSRSLSDVNVRVEIDHTYVGDLRIVLRSPAGTEVVLLDQPGVPDSSFGCGDSNLDVLFDDAEPTALEDHCAGTDPWFSGSAAPTQPLAAFNGQGSIGTWTLTVSDRAGDDTGALVDWDLQTTPGIVGLQCSECGGPTTTSTTSTTMPLVDLCAAMPLIGCRDGDDGKSKIIVKRRADADRDEIKWKLGRGKATDVSEFSNPNTAGTDIAFCLYDANGGPTLIVAQAIDGASSCDGAPCWRGTSRGFSFKNDGLATGLQKIKLQAGTDGKTKIDVKGKGAQLGLASLPLVTPVIAQLVVDEAGTQRCWETAFTIAEKSTDALFKAKGP